jgi:hypothetical protein
MATNFPTSVDNFTNPTANDSLNLPSHSTQHANANDAIEAIETYALQGLNYAEFLHIQDRKASGSGGGTFTSGAFRTRDLNSVMTNTITGASLSTNRITLPIGTYFIEAMAPAQKVDFHKAIVQGISPSTAALTGSSEINGSGTDVSTVSFVSGVFTFGAIQTIEIQHRCSCCWRDGRLFLRRILSSMPNG